MDSESLRQLRRFVDMEFRSFTREYGAMLERLFEPLGDFLLFSERLLTQSPWLVVMVAILLIVWATSRSLKIVAGTMITLLLIGYMGMWQDTMRTLAMIVASTLTALAIGLPIGILMSRFDRLQRWLTPALDIMQTMPSFVYLIPVLMLFGLGKVPAIFATVIYAAPPLIRLTDLGIRQVDGEVMEAINAFGANRWQQLFGVQLPLALPSIMAGINQTTMMALSMVVIASMIGARGLGEDVLVGIQTLNVGRGLEAGLAIVILAVVIDRITQAYGRPRHEASK